MYHPSGSAMTVAPRDMDRPLLWSISRSEPLARKLKKQAMTKLRILFCASEASPYAKTGGLADVVGALPPALKELGCDVRIFMPLYRCVKERKELMTPLAKSTLIPVGIHDYNVYLWESLTPAGVPVYFLEKDELYDRTHLYGTPERGDYEDNAERFIAFSRAVHSLCVRLNWFPTIFHLHDWQSALVAVYHHLTWRYDPNFIHSGTVFTIHNLAYQGLFPANHFSLTHLPPEVFSLQGMEFWGRCNFLKAGLTYSDFLTTVSARYSQEIQQPEFGCGLEGILQQRRNSLTGILNGIDTTIWDPKTDPLIPARFDSSDISGKMACKEALLSEVGLPQESRDKPLLGMISRLATQKGFDLLGEILEALMTLPISLVILGTGDSKIEYQLREMADRYPKQLKLLSRFDESLAHKIEAGTDIFLMPSRYEPCGLNQLYSLRYGTIPVVHATGGLEDSVIDVTDRPNSGTGFKFDEYKAEAFLDAIASALKLYQKKDKWHALQQRAMAKDFSWTRSAGEYVKIYEKVARSRRETKG
jgi:starch synthase